MHVGKDIGGIYTLSLVNFLSIFFVTLSAFAGILSVDITILFRIIFENLRHLHRQSKDKIPPCGS